MGRLKARTVAIADVSAQERDRLFAILHRYYEEITRAQFEQDFAAKNSVILLYSPKGGELHGFSTLLHLDQQVEGKRVRGVFSGDTVIEKNYWGGGALGVEFLKYLFRQMAKAPLTPFYWLLISKGYKTYLLMANNFDRHWPRYESETPTFERAVMAGVCQTLFGAAYDHERGVVEHKDSLGQLRAGVAAVTDELRTENPRVEFFAERNPGWQQGTELVCLAKMSWSMPFTYWFKVTAKQKRPPKKATATGDENRSASPEGAAAGRGA